MQRRQNHTYTQLKSGSILFIVGDGEGERDDEELRLCDDAFSKRGSLTALGFLCKRLDCKEEGADGSTRASAD